MKPLVIFYSLSGNTRKIAERIHKAYGGELIEVLPKKRYSLLKAVFIGCYRSWKEKSDQVIPERIDISDYDMIIVGTPVWAGFPTPVINGAVKGFTGCQGKKAFLFATCGGSPGKTFDHLRKILEKQGIEVVGEYSLDKEGIHNEESISALISLVQNSV